MYLIAIVVVTLITFSVFVSQPQWVKDTIVKRKDKNDKYKLPAEFWSDINEIELMLLMMHEGNAKKVYNQINKISDKYMRYYINNNYDYHMTRIINKYNDRIFLLTKNK